MTTKTPTIPKPPDGCHFALRVETEGDPATRDYGESFCVKARIATVCTDEAHRDCKDLCPEGGVFYGIPDAHDGPRKWLESLMLYSQGNCSEDAQHRHLYAWAVEYRDIFSADLEAMRVGLAILEAIHKRMDKEEKTFGRCHSYGTFVARVARALGCRYILIGPGDGRAWTTRQQRRFDNGYEYLSFGVPEGGERIDRIEDEWKRAAAEEACAS